MSRRSMRAVAAAALFGVMVGIRESTGLAPPPPTLTTERVEWLSPDRPDAGGFFLVLEDPEVTDADPVEVSARKPSAVRRWVRALRGRRDDRGR
ncbi:MAG: hypothetical protein AAF389_02880 [Gemmatimonadota bacterium]